MGKERLMIAILADFNHDGMIDEHQPPKQIEHPFAIAFPVPDIEQRVLDKDGGLQLLGGVHPIEVGAIRVRLSKSLPRNWRLDFRVDNASRGKVHLFRRSETDWEYLGAKGVWRVGGIRKQEIVLALVAGSFAHATERKDRNWNGEFIFTAAVTTGEGEEVATDSARFVVAPFLLASSQDPVEEVLVVKNRRTADFIKALRNIVPQTTARLSPIEVEDGTESDVWVQDTVEIGRVCAPSIQGDQQAVAVLAGIRAKHDGINCGPLDRHVRHYFSNLGAIVVEAASPRAGTGWIDWYGNLEVSPPVTARDGRKFPFGRILIGAQDSFGMHPDVLAFLEAQKLQVPPIVIDTSWLLIGHVDEVVSFVPAPDGRRFRVLIPSPSLARTILQGAASRGLGGQKVFPKHHGETTVKELLGEVVISAENEQIICILNEIQIRLCEGLGIDSSDFIEIPVLFKDGVAVIPNCVNGLICNGHVILPDPLGPRVNGEDAFAMAVRAPLESIGVEVHFVDIWEPYHAGAGEVHCGTNAIRRLRQPVWWNSFISSK